MHGLWLLIYRPFAAKNTLVTALLLSKKDDSNRQVIATHT